MNNFLEENFQKIKHHLEAVESDLEKKNKEIIEKSLKFKSIDNFTEDGIQKKDKIIKLNIGGKIFSTKLSILVTNKDTLFYHLLFKYSETNDIPNEIFIDRDYTYFPVIMEYLRYKKIFLQKYSQQDKFTIRKELDYYGIECKKMSDIFAIKGVDLCYGDVSSIKVKNFEEAVLKAKEWVVSPDRCANFSGDTLWLKNTKLTDPKVSGNHDNSISLVHGKSLDLLVDSENDIIQMDGIDFWGGDVKDFNTSFEDCIQAVKDWVISPDRCATFTNNHLWLKNLRKSSPKTNTTYHDKCISFVYGCPS